MKIDDLIVEARRPVWDRPGDAETIIGALADALERLREERDDATNEASHWNTQWRNVRGACEETCPSPEELDALKGENAKLRAVVEAAKAWRAKPKMMTAKDLVEALNSLEENTK